MTFNFNKENFKRIAWNAGVVGLSAAGLAICNYLLTLDLDPKTMAVLSVVIPSVKTFIEGFRKG